MSLSISAEHLEYLQRIVESSDVTFSRLSLLAGLNRAKDFRHANLRDVDFRGSDLRGFDFTGSDFTGAIKNSSTLIDESTIFTDARLAWIEAESSNIVTKMLEIQAAQSSATRRKLLSELQEQYRSANHIRQFLITSMRKANSIEAFFDFANAIHTSDDSDINNVIREEFRRLVENKGAGSSKGRKKLAHTPYGLDLITKLLDESINPFLRKVAENVFDSSDPISRLRILDAIGGAPAQFI